MEIKQLRHFLCLADTLHYGHAARSLYIGEQSLSRQIREMERELGFKLFNRTTRSVTLTEAGEIFKEGVQQSLDLLEASSRRAERAALAETGSLVLGADQGTFHSMLPKLVSAYRRQHPDARVEILLQNEFDAEDIRNGKVDACLMTFFRPIPTSLSHKMIRRNRAVVAVPSASPLAKRETLAIADLAHERILVGHLGEMPNGYHFVESLFESQGLKPNMAGDASSYLVILGMVVCGLGVAIVLDSMKDILAEDIAYIPLADPSVGTEMRLVWDEDSRTPAIDNLIAVANSIKESR